MKFVIKRDGSAEPFSIDKIIYAVEQSFIDIDEKVTAEAIHISTYIAKKIAAIPEELSVEEIQDLVEIELMRTERLDVAKNYIEYRYRHNVMRRENTTDRTLMQMLCGESEYWNTENANKNCKVVHTQRDYIAGIASDDITRRFFFDPELRKAHDKGILHFHDSDYFAQNVLYNCSLINLEDMLQNGTMINGVKIDKPHRLITAMTIATQIITAVSSSQYGGTTITTAHIAPFVRASKEQYIVRFFNILNEKENITLTRDEIIAEFNDKTSCMFESNSANFYWHRLVEESIKKEIADAVQTFNYQVNSMTTTNGQAPFLSVYLFISEIPEYEEENALLVEEFLNQRIIGFKNESNVYITPAFPKLLYVLDENNIYETSKYWHITDLAARCTAKRMVPDYISAKVMRELKNGNVYPCMGCVGGMELIKYKLGGYEYESTFEVFFERMRKIREYEPQFKGDIGNPNVFINTEDLKVPLTVYDPFRGYVKVKKVIRNYGVEWRFIKLSNGRTLLCTDDHPFPTQRGRVYARDLIAGMDCLIAKNTCVDNELNYSIEIVAESIPIVKYDYSYDVETESDHFEVSGIYSYNCRSFLTPDRTVGNIAKANNYDFPKFYGRFNQGVVTISLPDVALSAILKDINDPKKGKGSDHLETFYEILDERIEICHRALQLRHNRLCGGVSDMAPILWQNGALARLSKGESIKPLLYDGYSTISLGYAGLYECVKALCGESLTGVKGKKLGLEIMVKLNEYTKKWKEAENIDYSLYGTPIESTTYKFAKALKLRFGENIFTLLDGHDRNYITNSYHIPVFEEINPFDKLAIEAEFQKLSPGGAISYIECADLTKNNNAVLEVIKFIYDNIMYAELNTKSDYCQVCGYDGEIEIIDKDNTLDWKCPNCGNTDHSKMNIARRTCGYIGTNFFNQGRTNEIRDRYVHLDDHLL